MLFSENKQDIMSFRNLIKTLTDEELYNFTEKDLEVFNKIEKKQIIYNNDSYFFSCLNIVKKVNSIMVISIDDDVL